MINYVIGDATKPQGEGIKVIAHCVNNVGLFGAGFANALNKAYPKVRDKYLNWAMHTHISIGDLLVVPVENDLYVANLVGQNGVVSLRNPKPINYDALLEAMIKLGEWIKNKKEKVSIHCPRLGAGLAKGKWEVIEPLMELAWKDFNVYVYDLP